MKILNEKLRSTEGITLVALVVTIIILLILAGVALSSVLSQDGIFSRAEQATDKYGEAKARETLELALGEAQMQKYEQGLTDEQLTQKINEIGEEIEEREAPDISQAIVEGYIFSIDRTVPKILDYIGPAKGVIITATISGNNGWQKQGEAKVSVTGKIKTYSGGTITTVDATKGEEAISGFSIDAEGRYIIDNITEDTTIIINATDSNNETGNKIIPITIKIDGTAPTVETVTAEAEGMDIIISATGHDKNARNQEESGISKFHYTITPTDGVNQISGDFSINEKIKITTTIQATYTVSVTATDKVGNGPSEEKKETIKVEIPFGALDNTKKQADDGEWWIPKGFEEASESSSTIQGGKVIEDKSGNQWVWIPCYLGEKETSNGYQQYSKATEYKRTESDYTESLDKIDETSIKKYGGFYIGRYEAGIGEGSFVVKRNRVPYCNITLENCKIKSNNFTSENKYDENKVYTKLVSSYAWDTTLSFIAQTNSNYPTNSIEGNYSSSAAKNTGLTIAVCNIYDMGGNIYEYTTEKNTSSNYYITRGGVYRASATSMPASSRMGWNGEGYQDVGFRPLLYMK